MKKEIEKHKETYLSRRHIGRFLKNARKKKKLTLYAVAKMSGISIGQLQSVEKAKAAYTAETLIKITHALGIEVIFKDGEYSEQVNPAEQVGLCMVQVKVARQMYKPKRDNLVDGAGYFATLEKMEDEKNGKV